MNLQIVQEAAALVVVSPAKKPQQHDEQPVLSWDCRIRHYVFPDRIGEYLEELSVSIGDGLPYHILNPLGQQESLAQSNQLPEIRKSILSICQ